MHNCKHVPAAGKVMSANGDHCSPPQSEHCSSLRSYYKRLFRQQSCPSASVQGWSCSVVVLDSASGTATVQRDSQHGSAKDLL